MQYHRIPHSSLEISTLGLGTMTFGEQNSEADAHQQLDYAVANGINLIDVAEMYPVPPRPETRGLTETYVGNWLAKRGNREKLVLASKVSGPARNNDSSIRPNHVLDRKNIREALHASLKRLQTDYLDLYQVHWPQRPTNCFGKLGYTGRRRARRDAAGYPRSADRVPARREDPLHRRVERNRLRRDALSALADKHDLPRIVTIQNPYSLLNRSFEVGLAEVSQFEGVELLAYSCGFRHTDRQVSQRCEAGGGAQYAVQPLYALQQRAVAESGSGLCGYRQTPRPRSGANGAGLCASAAVCRQHPAGGDDHDAAAGQRGKFAA